MAMVLMTMIEMIIIFFLKDFFPNHSDLGRNLWTATKLLIIIAKTQRARKPDFLRISKVINYSRCAPASSPRSAEFLPSFLCLCFFDFLRFFFGGSSSFP